MAYASDCLSLSPKAKSHLPGSRASRLFVIQITMLFSICTAVALRGGDNGEKGKDVVNFRPLFFFSRQDRGSSSGYAGPTCSIGYMCWRCRFKPMFSPHRSSILLSSYLALSLLPASLRYAILIILTGITVDGWGCLIRQGCAKGLGEWIVNAWMGGSVGIAMFLFLIFWGWVKLRSMRVSVARRRVTSNVLGCRCVGLECRFPNRSSSHRQGWSFDCRCCRSVMLM